MFLDRRWFAQFDWILLGLCFLIPALGLVVLYSAGFDAEEAGLSAGWVPITIRSSPFVKQLMFLGAGMIALVAALFIPPQRLARYAFSIYTCCLLLLAVVLIFGDQSHGARRWLAIVGCRFQPSEFMKLCLILVMARYISKHPPSAGGYGFRGLVVPCLLVLTPMALIMRQPDLGTAISVGATGFAMILFAGIRPKAIVLMLIVVTLAALPAWSFLKPYQQRRVMALLNPEADPLGSGYHIIQSKIAVGSGGLSGKGYLNGTQSQLEFLPEHTTDFVFSVLAEEWGFAGAVVLLALYFCFLYRMLRLVGRSKDMFSALLMFGVTFLVFFHVVVNIGMVVGIFPVVGIPLLLVSYGGSSVVTILFMIGLMLGLNMRRLIFAAKS